MATRAVATKPPIRTAESMQVDFMILGAQKCATTSLFATLAREPGLVGAKNKEPHFFSTTEDWRRHLDDYHLLFERRPDAQYFEGSTSYTFYPHRNLEIWQDLYEYNPALQFIYVVRDPIDRLVSAYMHNVARGYTTEPLNRFLFTNPLLLNVTRYAMQIKPFIDRFGNGQVLLLEFSDLVGKRESTLHTVAEFLGVTLQLPTSSGAVHANKSIGKEGQHHLLDDPGMVTRVAKRYLPPLYRWKVRRMTPPPESKPVVEPKLRRAVLRLLDDDICQLETLMERDLSCWREPAPVTELQ